MSHGFRINKEYADKYNTWRQKEELQKLKQRYGDANLDNDSESSSSESEDEDAEALTEQVEKDWLRTLSALKSKNPSIYNKDIKFYKDETPASEDADTEDNNQKKKKKKDKPLYLKDYERKVIVEKGGILSDEDEASDEGPGPSLADRKGYYEEQEELRKSLAKATADADSDSSDDEDLLTKRKKSKDEKDEDKSDYLQWLKGQKKSLKVEKEVGIELEPLKEYWHNPELDTGEKFLRDYMLNKQYIDREDESIPTYDEVVEDGDGFSDEEELLVKQDNFERKYNFRFEEPEAEKIPSFPRVLEDSVRRKDTKRSEKRQEVKERKKKDKERKKEEIKQLKKLKRQEIMSKIDQLKEITGNQSLGIDESELDNDFDPAKHDRMMQEYFDDQYYHEGDSEELKPVFDDMSDDGEMDGNWDSWAGRGGAGDGSRAEDPHVDDPDFCMDADYDPSQQPEKKKKNKKKNKLAQVLAKKKPVFDPKDKTFEEYFDEYYKLDYEDIIDDMPCRFKYRKVTPNDYGLSVNEVLKCRDKELNAWVSLKKMSQYRTEQEEHGELSVYSRKGKNMKKKGNVLPSLFHADDDDDDSPQQLKSSKGQDGVRRADTDMDTAGPSSSHKGKRKFTDDVDDEPVAGKKQKLQSGEETNKKKKKNKKIKNSTLEHVVETAEDNARTENVKSKSTKKKDKKKKKKLKQQSQESETSLLTGVKSKQESDATSVKITNEGQANIKTVSSETNNESKNEKTEKHKKKNKKKKNKEGQKLKMSDERLKAYGINPKKYKYMQKDELFQIKPRTEKT